MSGGRRCKPPLGLPRHFYRIRYAHYLADRPAEDMDALLRKARAVFLLRARVFDREAGRQGTENGKAFFRRAAVRELNAARMMHRLVMAREDYG